MTTKNHKNPRWLLFVALLAVFAVFAVSCGDDSSTSSTPTTTAAPAPTTTSAAADEMPETPATTAAPAPTTTTATTDEMVETPAPEPAPEAPITQGPAGEAAVAASEISLTDSEIAEVQAGGYTAALLWHTTGAFVNAVTAGARAAFAELGIDVIAETSANFDAAQQANDVETVLAQDPDIIISLAIGPDSGAAAFQPAVNKGVSLVFLSNVPQGYVHGEDYVGIVTDDLAAMGITAADLLADALGGTGNVGYIFHDAAYYVTNQRDQAFKSWLQAKYPDIEIVAEQGISDQSAEEIASAMLIRNPDIDGIYTPWAAGPADGVLAALRAAGASDVAVVTMDLDTNVALDMVEGGNMVGIAADEAYNLGRTMALEGAYGVLGKPAPAFVVVPAIGVTAENIVEGYRQSLNDEPPEEVLEAIGG